MNDKECVLSDFSIPDPDTILDDSEVVEDVDKFVDEEQLKLIQEISDSRDRDESRSVEIDVTEFDKEKRSSFHKSIKIKFGRFLMASTVDRDDKKFIQIRKKSRNDRSQPGRWQYPHDYVHFTMYKENIDTLQAISALSNRLKMKPALFMYAGTKDKRAKTCQWISVKRVDPSKICQSARVCQGVRIGNFKFVQEPLKLGALNGNRFKIALRAVTGDREQIEKGLESLRDYGFINYYGLQRFGNCVKVPTFLIGKALLSENFSEACELILKERDGEPHYMTQMRSIYAETKDPHQALKILHSTNTTIEARLLRGLVKHGDKNCLQALLMLPKNMLTLYTHAYQSYIWNHIASKRREMGIEVIEGDLVFTETENPPPNEVEIIEDAEAEEEEPTNEVEESKFLSMVRPLTKEDVESGKFTIYDIVLPLPGHDIKYPSNELQESYKELLTQDNLTSESLKNKHNVFSLTGAYRKVFIKPKNMSWKFMKYSGQVDLILSDYSRMCGDQEPEDDENGDNLALIVDLTLPPSAYATMALRELMKCDTNVGNHIKMENQLKAKEDERNNKRVNEDEIDVEQKKIKLE